MRRSKTEIAKIDAAIENLVSQCKDTKGNFDTGWCSDLHQLYADWRRNNPASQPSVEQTAFQELRDHFERRKLREDPKQGTLWDLDCYLTLAKPAWRCRTGEAQDFHLREAREVRVQEGIVWNAGLDKDVAQLDTYVAAIRPGETVRELEIRAFGREK